MKNYITIGGGIGGCCASVMLLAKTDDVLILEKESYLGGCSSTFVKNGFKYNTGATTFAMFEPNHIVYDFFAKHKIEFKYKKLNHSHVVLHKGKKISRFLNVDDFVNEINSSYPHKKNEQFWRLVKEINNNFFAKTNYIYSCNNRLKSAISMAPLFIEFAPYMLCSAKFFIKNFFGENISQEYQDFIDAQILIVAQTDSSKVNFLTAALALGYSFYQNCYVYGGMGEIFKAFELKIKNVATKTSVQKIKKISNGFEVITSKDSFYTKNIVLNTPIFDSAKLFDDVNIQKYCNSFKRLDAKQSAFMVYFKIKSSKDFEYHYQIIENEILPHTISKAIFVSFSDKNDDLFDGFYSVTASIHTLCDFWLKLDQNEYRKKKEIVVLAIKSIICTRLNIQESEIVDYFGATPKTFLRYIGRSSLGGSIMSTKNQFFGLCTNDTPFNGLYAVGDTTFAAQGWPGVIMGVKNLECII